MTVNLMSLTCSVHVSQVGAPGSTPPPNCHLNSACTLDAVLAGAVIVAVLVVPNVHTNADGLTVPTPPSASQVHEPNVPPRAVPQAAPELSDCKLVWYAPAVAQIAETISPVVTVN